VEEVENLCYQEDKKVIFMDIKLKKNKDDE